MWRYKLPCGHHTIRYSASEEREGVNAYNENLHTRLYKCEQCERHFEYKIDKKSGDKVFAD